MDYKDVRTRHVATGGHTGTVTAGGGGIGNLVTSNTRAVSTGSLPQVQSLVPTPPKIGNIR